MEKGGEDGEKGRKMGLFKGWEEVGEREERGRDRQPQFTFQGGYATGLFHLSSKCVSCLEQINARKCLDLKRVRCYLSVTA